MLDDIEALESGEIVDKPQPTGFSWGFHFKQVLKGAAALAALGIAAVGGTWLYGRLGSRRSPSLGSKVDEVDETAVAVKTDGEVGAADQDLHVLESQPKLLSDSTTEVLFSEKTHAEINWVKLADTREKDLELVYHESLESSKSSEIALNEITALDIEQPLTKKFGAGFRSLLDSGSTPTKVGAEFQVNTYTAGHQYYPSIASLSNGKFVITWDSDSQDGDGRGIYAQLYNSGDTKFGAEFQVNTYTAGHQYYPSIASLSNGKFVITWVSESQDGSYGGVYGQLYNSDSTKSGFEFQVNTYTAGEQWYSSVSSLNNGKFVVTWQSDGQDGSYSGIYGQLYNSDGIKFGAEFQINTYTANEQWFPSVTSLSDGKFVVTWQSYIQDGNSYGIYGQLYHSDGTKSGTEFRVNTYTTDEQLYPSVASLSDGKFVVTWQSMGQDGSNSGIYGQLYHSDGTKFGTEFQVNTFTAENRYELSVASLSDGKFVVTWGSLFQDGNHWGVYGQLYHSDGTKSGIEFQVNTYTTNSQVFSSVAGLIDGKFVVTWQSDGQDGSGYGIYGQIFSYPVVLTLTANQLNIAEGATLTLALNNFNAFSPGISASSLTFTVSGLQYGQFERISAAGVAITTFTLQDIKDGQIKFVHDGGEIAPSYAVSVSDGVTASSPVAAPIIFTNVNDAPVLTTNQLTITGGQTVILSASNFNVTDSDTGPANLTFTISEIQHGRFERISAAGITITTFTFEDIQNNQIQFVHDGSDIAPSYSVTVGDGLANTVVVSGNINFNFVSHVGAEFQVNTYTASDQSYPSVAGLSDGKFVVTWQSSGHQDGSGHGIYGQLYNSNGTKFAIEFQVNTYAASNQWHPSVAGLKNGKFVATWMSSDQDRSDWGIYGQLYNSDGIKLGAEFQVNTYTISDQYYSSVTGLGDGKFVVTWDSNGQDGSGHGVYGQLYSNDGTKFGAEFQINTYTTYYQGSSSVTGLSDGKFVVTWSGKGQYGSEEVYGQLYNSDGTKFGIEFQVNTYTFNGQGVSSVSGLSDGKFVVTWHSWLNGWGTYGQLCNSDGTKFGAEFQVHTYTGNEKSNPSVSDLSDGKFVVTWRSDGQDGSSYGIYGQLYHSDGTRSGAEFQVNTYTASSQTYPSVAGLSDGKFVVTWQSDYQDGSGAGVYGQIFSYPVVLTLTANQLNVAEGATLILALNNFNAFSPGISASGLTFTISGLQYGQFERISASGVAITAFTLQDIKDGQIKFVHDGGEIAPSYAVSVSDGITATSPAAAPISFTNVNDAPVITVSSEPISYTEDSVPVVIAPALSITDTDSANLKNATVAITDGFNAAEDVLSFAEQSGIIGNYSSSNSTLIFTGIAPIIDYQALLRTVTYKDTSQNPSTANRTISFQVTDEEGAISEAVTKTIQVITVNDQPVVNFPLRNQTGCCGVRIGEAYNFTFAVNTFFDADRVQTSSVLRFAVGPERKLTGFSRTKRSQDAAESDMPMIAGLGAAGAVGIGLFSCCFFQKKRVRKKEKKQDLVSSSQKLGMALQVTPQIKLTL